MSFDEILNLTAERLFLFFCEKSSKALSKALESILSLSKPICRPEVRTNYPEA